MIFLACAQVVRTLIRVSYAATDDEPATGSAGTRTSIAALTTDTSRPSTWAIFAISSFVIACLPPSLRLRLTTEQPIRASFLILASEMRLSLRVVRRRRSVWDVVTSELLHIT